MRTRMGPKCNYSHEINLHSARSIWVLLCASLRGFASSIDLNIISVNVIFSLFVMLSTYMAHLVSALKQT